MPRFVVLLVLAVLLAGITACAVHIPVPVSGPLPEEGPADIREPPATARALEAPAPLPQGFRVKPFSAGEATLYGFRITPALAAAMQAMLAGDVDAALAHLDAEDPPGKPVEVGERLYRWFLSAYRAHILNLAGRTPEAEQEVLRTRDREIALRGGDLIARLLRGDARIRLGDLRAGDADYASVLRVLGAWEFPTRFSGPPANQVDLAIMTEAKSRVYLGLAVRYALDGQYQRALQWGTLTEQHFAAVFSVMNHPLYGPFMGRPHHDIYMARAVNLSFLAAAKQALGHDPGEVARLAEVARSYYDAIGFPPGHVYLESLQAKAFFDTGHPEQALQIGRRATKRAQELNLPDFVWRVEALMGEGLLRAGRKGEAEQALRDAQIAVDRIVGALGSDRDKRRFGVNKENITVYLTSLDFERRDAKTLFQDLERGRARAFVDMLAAVDLSKTRHDLDELREVSRLARQKVLASELGQTRAASGDELEELIEKRTQQVERVRRRNAALADAVAVHVPELASIQAALSAHENLVYWLPGFPGDRLRALVISRAGTQSLEFPLTQQGLRETLQQFHAAIARQDGLTQQRIAVELTELLQVKSWMGAAGSYVLPSGSLHFVPWGILDISQPVVVIPTAGWLLHHSPVQPPHPAAVVGDPEFGGKLPPLRAARREAIAIAKYFGVEPLIGPDATEKRLREQVGRGVSVLHLATHGLFNATRPLQSAIILSNGTQAAALTAEKLFEEPLPARLVVLSACETGVGEAVAGDDFLGLPRSLYLGGASTVLSSLWPVEDRATAQFMEIFHQEARREGDYGKAWLKARDELRARGSLPWIYGAFVLGGGRSVN